MFFERMDRLVTIQKVVRTVNATSGEPVEVWSDTYNVWAQKRGLAGSENFKAEAEVSKANCLWYIRYIHNEPFLDGQDYRLKDEQGVVWDIIGEPREIGRREAWELACQRRA